MKIGFDVSQTAENKAGCGFLADQLIRALVLAAPEHEYLLYPSFYGYQAQDPSQATRPAGPQVQVINLQQEPDYGIDFGWKKTGFDRTAKLGNPDVIHSNNFSCPQDISGPRRGNDRIRHVFSRPARGDDRSQPMGLLSGNAGGVGVRRPPADDFRRDPRPVPGLFSPLSPRTHQPDASGQPADNPGAFAAGGSAAVTAAWRWRRTVLAGSRHHGSRAKTTSC